MPPRPFPLPYSIGTDICHIPRVRGIYNAPSRERSRVLLFRFLSHIFTFRETDIFWARFKSVKAVLDQACATTNSNDKIAAHLAGRWAAKEAVVKAISWRSLTMDEIEILPRHNGKGVYALILDRAIPTKKPSALSLEAMHKMRATLLAGTLDTETHPNGRKVNVNAAPSNNGDARAQISTPSESDDDSAAFESDEWLADDDSATGDVVLPQEYVDPPGQIAQVSISHDGEYATAVCLAAEPPVDTASGGRSGIEAG